VVNSDVIPTAQFQTNQGIDFSKESMLKILRQLVGDERLASVSASFLATRLMGDSIATNVFMLGYALQKGLIPLPVDAVEKAIELNGVGVKANLHTLSWGRMAAFDPDAVDRFIKEAEDNTMQEPPLSETLEQLIQRRVDFLTRYQSSAYAREFLAFVGKVQAAEQNLAGVASTGLTEAVARYLSKLMAYKDEYEVARLYTSGDFQRRLKQQFDGDYKLQFHLAPPMLSPTNRKTGKPGKIAFGAWMFSAFRFLAKFKGLRGTPLDIFGYTPERKRERQLIQDYRATIETLMGMMNESNHAGIVEIASLPEMIKGFGYIKDENVAAYEAELAKKLTALDHELAKAA